MFESILYIILAVLGLSFLIFIHELGHYYMARKVGMRVETFSIGFGRPIISWIRDGVKWQIGWLLFGGYVKIAGTEADENQDPYEVKDGFFGKGPVARILVALMGPLTNILFALLAFGLLWFFQGREKNFREYTHRIGWVDPKSELFAKGIRPGDEINTYNGEPSNGAKDLLMVPMMSQGAVDVQGVHYDEAAKNKVPFEYSVNTYPHPEALEKGLKTIGLLQPASYLIYNRLPSGAENPLPEGSPIKSSGIQYGDRIVWVDGVTIFSNDQLSHVLNDSKTLLTIQRGDQVFLRRVPRIQAEELKLDAAFKEELIDWQFEGQLNNVKIQKLYFIPYNLTNNCIVEASVKFIDQEKEEEAFPPHPFSQLELPLEVGDKILAVDGSPVDHSSQILVKLQEHQVLVIVEREKAPESIPLWNEADRIFDQQYKKEDLQTLVAAIGTGKGVTTAGNLVVLNPIIPKTRKDYEVSPETKALITSQIEIHKKEIESISDPEKRARAMHALENMDKQLFLGLPYVQDQKVLYNPKPLTLFQQVFEEIRRTLGALFTGSLNPKWLSGPIGIVQVVHDNSMAGWKEALYWLGAISLNLGILNLLPLPVLDGGTILLSFFELITGRRLKPKTLERLIIPFALLLIGLFIFLTYYDITRLLKNFF